MKRFAIILPVILILLTLRTAYAQLPEINNGLNYLAAAQNQDGSWGDGTSRKDILPETVSVMETFQFFNLAGNTGYAKALSWLQSQPLETTEYLAERMLVLSSPGADKDKLLSYMSRVSNAWGGYDAYGASIIDTTLALQALRTVNFTDSNTVRYVLGYLMSVQNADGGWGFYPGDNSNTYMTAVVLKAFSQFKTVYDLQQQINKAVVYLFAKQNSDGGFGSSPSTIHETALAFDALAACGANVSSITPRVLGYLTSAQQTNGSWNNDPYSTALALRVLAQGKTNITVLPADVTFAPQPATVGDEITISAAIRNTSVSGASSVPVRFFDGDPATGGVIIGDKIMTVVPAGGNATASIAWTAAISGVHNIFVIADPDNRIEEGAETDNTAIAQIRVYEKIDLAIQGISISPEFPAPGQSIVAQVTVANLGGLQANNAVVRLSVDGAVVGEKTISSLVSLQQQTIAFTISNLGNSIHQLTVSLDPDSLITEVNRTNNILSQAVEVKERRDLVASSAGIFFSESGPKEGETLSIAAGIINAGSSAASNVAVRFYDGNPAAGGTQIGADQVIQTVPAGGSDCTDWIPYPTTGKAGSRSIYVVVDPQNAIEETNELNNAASATLTVIGRPDLTIQSMQFSPANAEEGDSVQITAVVKNAGSAANTAVPIFKFYLGDPSAGGEQIGSDIKLGIMNPGSSSNAALSFNTSEHAGDNRIFAVVDPTGLVDEIDETNNTLEKTLTVQASTRPDFTVSDTDISFSPVQPAMGGSVTVSVQVHNLRNTAASNLEVSFYDGDPAAGGNLIGGATIPSLAGMGSGQAAISWDLTGLTGLHSVFVKVDPANTITETNETNNTASSNVKFKLPQGAAPVNLTAAPATDTTIDLAWQPGPEADAYGVVGYNVYRNNVLANRLINIAGEGTAEASSSYSTYTAAMANDGNINTNWYANNNTPAPQWWSVSFTTARTIKKIVVYWNSSYYGKNFEVQTWDGSQWVTQATVTGNSKDITAYEFPSAVTTDKVRINVTAGNFTSYVAIIREVYVYEENRVSSMSYEDSGLGAGNYSYYVTAVNRDGVESLPSNTASASLGDTTPPFPPTGMTATVSGFKVNTAWNANAETDLAGYRVYRDGQNVALRDRSAWITGTNDYSLISVIDGIPSSYGYTTWDANSQGSMTVILSRIYPVTRLRMLLYDAGDNRFYRYKIESSTDGQTWTMISDKTAGTWRGWQEVTFGQPVQARFFRITGTFSSVDNRFCVSEFEAYTSELSPKTLDVYSGFGISVVNYKNLYEYTYDWNAGVKKARRFVFSNFNLEEKDVLAIYDKDTNLLLANYTGDLGFFITPPLTAANYRFKFIADDEGTATGYTIAGYMTLGNQAASTYSDTIYQNGSYSYAVSAIDKTGNESALSDSVIATVKDSTPPAVPRNLASTTGNRMVNLTWTANGETDFAGYNIYRNGDAAPLNGSRLITASFYKDESVVNLTAYSYQISAVDINGNESAKSTPVTAKPSGIDLVGTLKFSAFPAQINTAVDISMVIINQGSQDATSEFAVSFYKGNPSAGGVLIGRNVITGVPAGGSVLSSISWAPDKSEEEIFAVVDPDNVIPEFDRANNTTSRKLYAFENLKTLYMTYVYTLKDLVPFAYRDVAHITVFRSDDTLYWSGVLQNGEHTTMSPGAGVYQVFGTQPYTLLTGDPVSGQVLGYHAIDDKNLGLSKNFHTYMTSFWGSGCKFIIFAYEDDTKVQLINSGSNAVIWSGTLNKGEHYENTVETEVSGKFLRVVGSKPVSALTYTDQGYYIPSENGTFFGQQFYTYAGLVGGWPEDINVIAFEDNTNVIIRNTTTGQILWEGTLNEGDVHSENINGYYTVEADRKVTAGVFPFKSYTRGYYHMAVPYDPTGTGVGKLFFAPAIGEGILHVFSYEDGAAVKIIDWRTKSTVWQGTLNAGEFKKIDTLNTVYRIESSGNVSAIEGWGDSAGADFVPTYYAAVTDLEVYKMDVLPERILPGDNTLITATIANRGDTALGNITVGVYVDDQKINTFQIDLEPYTSTDIQANWQATTGYHKIKVVVDPDDKIPEQNELNNIISVNKFVQNPQLPSTAPDLVISSKSISFSRNPALKGETVSIDAAIRNDGTVANDILVLTYLGDPLNGGVQIGSGIIPYLDTNSTATIRTQWTVDKPSGAYDICVKIDPFNEISEMDETNNIAFKVLTVAEKQISLQVATDKLQYLANSNVGITASVENFSTVVLTGAGDVFIEDQAGNRVATVGNFSLESLKPIILSGWSYRIPVSITAAWDMKDALASTTIDFAPILTALDISGKTIDRNSIRAIEFDVLGNLIGERKAKTVFHSDTNAEVTWLMSGTTATGTSRYFSIYFDTSDHGGKPPSTDTKLPLTGKLIAFSDDTGNIYAGGNNGDGSFSAPKLLEDLTTATDYTRGIALDDFNNDGFVDIITGSGSTGDIYYYQNKADGSNTFLPKIKVGTITASSYLMGITVSDFNKDGAKDFVVSGNTYNQLYLFTGAGDGTFTQISLAVPSGNNTFRGKTAADVDGDGNTDLVVATAGSAIYLYRGSGSGAFQPPVLISSAGSDTYGLVGGDFDGDGKFDIIFNRASQGDAYFLKGNGDGTFGTALLVPSLDTNSYTAFAAGDFNNDGLLDVIAATSTNRTIEFYPGKGDGTFGLKTTITTLASGNPFGISSSPALADVHPLPGSPEPVPAQAFNFVWNTGNTYAGSYKAHITLSEGGGVIAENSAPFVVLPDVLANALVVPDKVSYNPHEVVTLTSTVTSLSKNAVFEKLSATVTVKDKLGTTLYNETKPVTTLMPGASYIFRTYWNTGTYAAGTYPVTLEVRDTANSLIATGTGNLVISSIVRPSTQLQGQITLDRQSIMTGETVTASYSVTNIGNMDLQDVGISVLTINAKDLAVYNTIADLASLNMGGIYQQNRPITATNFSAKDYLVVLRAKIGNTEETLAGTYLRVEGAPTAPSLLSPPNGASLDSFTPALSVNNASDPNDDKLTYEFELYADSGLTQPAASSGLISETSNATSWQVPVTLTENSTYYWRSRAYDGKLYGPWMETASFRVNTVNDPPTAPVISSPADNDIVASLTPALTVLNATDPDSAGLTYNFDLALDSGFTQIVSSTTGIAEGPVTTTWQVPVSLTENTTYYWRSQADDWITEGPWSTTGRFFINTVNEPPTTPVIIAPVNGASLKTLEADITVRNSTDPDSPDITYEFELDTSPSFDPATIIRSGAIQQGLNSTTCHVSGLAEDKQYYVRAKASDGQAESAWSNIVGFFINSMNSAPTAPTLANPSDGAGVTEFTPTLSVNNSTDPDRDVLTYEFEVYADESLKSLVSSAAAVAESSRITSWMVPLSLTENKTYYWRARAFDGDLRSPWMDVASFTINTANDAPGAPVLLSPIDGSTIATLTPTLVITNAEDPDNDKLTYEYEVYQGGVLVAGIKNVPENSSGETSTTLAVNLADNTVYQWRVRAFDGDRYGPWTSMASFTIHICQKRIKVDIDFEPETLNKKDCGKWVLVRIELPHGYKTKDVDISSIRLEDSVHAEPWPFECRVQRLEHGCSHDRHGHGHEVLMVKFRRSEVIKVLPTGKHVPVHVTGIVKSIPFEGVDIIRVTSSGHCCGGH